MFTAIALGLSVLTCSLAATPKYELEVVNKVEGGGKCIKLVNSCSFPIELGATGGFAGVVADHKDACPTNQENDGTGRCFWNLSDMPDTLSSNEEWSTTLSGDGTLYSGMIFGAKTMKQYCPSDGCRSFVGPVGVVTKAEMTLFGQDPDFYDISTIEGANLPMTMRPVETSLKVEGDPYICGVAAGTCKWKYDPREHEQYLTVVEGGDGTCKTKADCKDGLVCGVNFSEWQMPKYGVCGEHRGWASAHANCIQGSQGFPFFCEKHGDMLGCGGEYSRSPYNTLTGKVCGCPNFEKEKWDTHDVMSCVSSDKDWEKHSLPWVRFLGEGCGTSYLWAYSDFSATFVCPAKEQEYIIEFCPGDSEEVFFV